LTAESTEAIAMLLNTPTVIKETPLLFPGLTWQQFKTIEPMLDVPGVRLSFLDGLLEIQRMPGEEHESVKERIGTLLEFYLLHIGIDYKPTGSMALENEQESVRREADKSYKLGENRSRPDLAIEVTVTSGGIDKLKAYQKLQIPEVWFWEDGTLSIHHLRSEAAPTFYEKLSKSEVLPDLDIELLKRCLLMVNHVEAVRAFQQGIQRQ
jgi:Uma2 family endonuclease